MKLNMTQRILLGFAVGAGAYLLYERYNRKSMNKVVTTAGTDSDEEPTTRQGKVEYILANVEADSAEEKSGFAGDRFRWNPLLGYDTPVGVVRETDAGEVMDISREGNLAHEVYFNADGVATDDPTAEAEAVLSEMTDAEIDLAYKMVKAKKNNPNMNFKALADRLNVPANERKMFNAVIGKRLNDIKALKKSPKWKVKWEARKQRLMEFFQGLRDDLTGGRGKSAPKGNAYGHATNRPVSRKKQKRDSFAQEVINRRGGSMWGGHRNDGAPTNMDAHTPM